MKRSWRAVAAVAAVGLSVAGLVAGTARAQGAELTVSGRVVDSTGSPVAGATVFVDGGPETTADGDGRFSLGLAAGRHVVRAGAAGTTVASAEVAGAAGETVEVELVVAAAEIALDEVTVTASFSLLGETPLAPVALDREEIVALPHFADDLYRAVAVLPGVASNDFSAAFSVRGGLHDELLVRLDGHELFEPFHLKDFQGVFSAVDPETVGAVELLPGAFPAEYGDRMTGVLELTTRRAERTRGALGISFSNAWANGGGRFGDGGVGWLGSLRRGYLDVVLGFVGDDDDDEEPDPRYWDAFAKLDGGLGPGGGWRALVHHADDELLFREDEDDEVTRVDTGYGSTLVGLGHDQVVGDAALVETTFSWAAADRRREVDSFDDDENVRIADRRDLEAITLRQAWSWLLGGGGQYWKWGAEARRYAADYRYANDFRFDDPIDDPRFLPASGLTRFDGEVESERFAAWAADRLRLGRLTLELGLRWDRQRVRDAAPGIDFAAADDDQLGPRVNAVAELGAGGVVRAGWGLFHQPQRPNELDVAYGETRLFAAQESEHWALGWERPLGAAWGVRVDAYRRRVDDPRPRFETLFDPVSPLPEVENDRVRIDAERVEADGVEVTLRHDGGGHGGGGRTGGRFGGWLSYAWSEIDEVVAGGRRQPRSIDQTHAVTWNGRWRFSERWQANWVWTFHTGWPTTALAGERVVAADGSLTVVETVGPFYAERLPDYHRLDLRLSRRSRLGRGTLTLFLDVQNLYDRDNLRGLDADDSSFRRTADGRVVADYEEVEWLGIVPSFGVSWEF